MLTKTGKKDVILTISDASQRYTSHPVVSEAGTVIDYRQLGSGPGLVLVQSGAQSARNFMKLAADNSGKPERVANEQVCFFAACQDRWPGTVACPQAS